MTETYTSSSGAVITGPIKRGFEGHEADLNYSKALQRVDWDLDFVGTKTAANASISDDEAVTGDHSLKVTYRSDDRDAAASSWRLPEEQEYYLSYWVKFEDGFDFDGDEHSGGKLPGLASEGLASGGSNVTGTNGFTARYMWRDDGEAELYLYHMDKPGSFGESFKFLDAEGEPIKFQAGQWHNLVQRVKINDSGSANGEVDVWLDDTQVLDLDGLRFVSDGSGIDRLYFSSFFGGGDDGWLPERDVNAYFDDFIVSTDAGDVGLNDPIADQSEQVAAASDGPLSDSELPVPPVSTVPDIGDADTLDIDFELAKEWNGGFKGVVSVTNDTAEAVDDWALRFETAGFNVVKLWGADLTEDGELAIVSGSGRDADIASGESVEFGFIADGATPVDLPDISFL